MRLSFELHEYIDPHGNVQSMVKMTKDGFVVLAMGSIAEAATTGR
jgi:phage regulator Rha-like protein